METRVTLIAIGYALLASILWAGNFAIARGVHEWIEPFTLAYWRWLVAFAAFLPFSYKALRREWPVVRASWKFILVMGTLGVGTYNTLVYMAGHYTSTHHISLIASTAPIWTLALAGIFGTERLSRYKIGGALLAFIGALVIVTHGHLESALYIDWNNGDILVLIAALLWGFYCVMLHYKPKGLSTHVFLTVIIAVGMVVVLPFYIWEAVYVAPTPFTVEAWGIYLYVGVASSVVAWMAWNMAVQMIGPVKASLVYYTVPVFSAVMAVFLLDEPLFVYHFAGFACICAGIVISNLRKLGIVHQ